MYNAYDFANRNRPTTNIASYGNKRNYTITPIAMPKVDNNAYMNSNANSQLNQGLGALGQAAGKYLATSGNDSGILSSLMGSGGSGSAISNAANNYVSTGSSGYGGAIANAADDYISGSGASNFGGGNLGWIGAAQGAGRGLGSLLEGGSIDNAGQSFFNINEDDSEIEQALSGAFNGAQMGSAAGPWGAAIGGVLGLGASFLDDI